MKMFDKRRNWNRNQIWAQTNPRNIGLMEKNFWLIRGADKSFVQQGKTWKLCDKKINKPIILVLYQEDCDKSNQIFLRFLEFDPSSSLLSSWFRLLYLFIRVSIPGHRYCGLTGSTLGDTERDPAEKKEASSVDTLSKKILTRCHSHGFGVLLFMSWSTNTGNAEGKVSISVY